MKGRNQALIADFASQRSFRIELHTPAIADLDSSRGNQSDFGRLTIRFRPNLKDVQE